MQPMMIALVFYHRSNHYSDSAMEHLILIYSFIYFITDHDHSKTLQTDESSANKGEPNFLVHRKHQESKNIFQCSWSQLP